MLNSVKLNGIDVFDRFRCYLAHYEVSAPAIKDKYADIPLRNGKLDLTELLTGDVKYDSRPVKIRLMYVGKTYNATYSDIVNFCHGKRMTICFDDDAMYFYTGRLTVKDYDNKKYGGLIEIEAMCDPFKYTVVSSDEPWIWDSFNFENGYINELQDIVVNGTKTVTLIADEQLTYAKITSNAQMDVTYGGTTVRVGVGTTTLYDFEFAAGENTITLRGTGIVSISYRGGRL